jgi:hypothetical protein
MRRLAFLALPVTVLALAGQAGAVPRPDIGLDKGAISSKQCTQGGAGAKQFVDISFRLTNYTDSGYVGAWAIDTVKRHLRIWRQPGGTFCAQVQDDPSEFITVGGIGPTGSSYLAPGIKGTFEGGYIVAGIGARFKAGFKTYGDLGTFDAQCDLHFDCKGNYPWWGAYFANTNSGGFARWGWLYEAGTHGSWLDQFDVVPPHGGDIR